MFRKQALTPSTVSAPIGPYSHSYSFDAGDTRVVFVAGQCGTLPDGSIAGENDMYEQARQTLINIEKILEANGATFSDVVKTTTFLTDVDRRADVSRARESFLPSPPPPSTLIEVSRLIDPEYLIEMEVVAVVSISRD